MHDPRARVGAACAQWLCVAVACVAWAAVAAAATEEAVVARHQYCIVGAGPAGLQLGYFLKKDNRCGASPCSCLGVCTHVCMFACTFA